MRDITNKLVADMFVNLLYSMRISKSHFHGSCNERSKDSASFELELQDQDGSDRAIFSGSISQFKQNDLQLSDLSGHWIQYYKGDEDNEKIDLFFDTDEDNSIYVNLLESVKNHILKTKQYRYFCDDYHRLNKNNISSYLIDLTKDGLLEWEESIEQDYGEHGCIYLYTGENGEESYKLYINDVDDDWVEEDDDMHSFDYFLDYLSTLNNQLEVNVSNHLTLSYDDVISDDLVQLVTTGAISNGNVFIDVKDVIVRSNNFECIHSNHNLKHVKALVNVMTSTGIKEMDMDAAYCPECDQYYILESTYNRLKAYGRICCQIVEFSVMRKLMKSNGSSWAEKSTLSMYGYNVNAKDNLSEAEREEILAFLMENDIVSAYWIASFLGRQIESRESNPHMENAIHKWEHDIRFVENYEKTNTAVRVKNIYVQKKKYY